MERGTGVEPFLVQIHPPLTFSTTLLSKFEVKGARDFCPENVKNRPQSGRDRHSEAGFLWFYSILGRFCPKSKKIA